MALSDIYSLSVGISNDFTPDLLGHNSVNVSYECQYLVIIPPVSTKAQIETNFAVIIAR